ncbi:hypothetical protein ACGFNX_27190 [Streptomyces sp. NPDC048723]|uniref:hypothetical protein n=1 Tax=Streptomyces sp. NPDC048723 TaxID=3365589 RepID=UPI003710F6DA
MVPTITDADLRAVLNPPAPGTTDAAAGDAGAAHGGFGDGAARTTALHLAVLKAMTQHGLRRVLVYFHLVEDATRFTRELGHTLRLLRRNAPDLRPVPGPRPGPVLRPRGPHPR